MTDNQKLFDEQARLFGTYTQRVDNLGFDMEQLKAPLADAITDNLPSEGDCERLVAILSNLYSLIQEVEDKMDDLKEYLSIEEEAW